MLLLYTIQMPWRDMSISQTGDPDPREGCGEGDLQGYFRGVMVLPLLFLRCLQSWVAEGRRLLAGCQVLGAVPCQRQHRRRGGNAIPFYPCFCAAAGSGSAFGAGLPASGCLSLAAHLCRQRHCQRQRRSRAGSTTTPPPPTL